MREKLKITCGIYLFNPDNELLVCHPTETAGGIYSIPKGLHEKDESLIDTVIRELKEETSIDIKSISDQVYYVGLEMYTDKNKLLIGYTTKLLEHIPIDELYCDSLFKSRISGKMIPEVEKFKWVQFNKFKHNIQPEQVRLWERTTPYFCY